MRRLSRAAIIFAIGLTGTALLFSVDWRIGVGSVLIGLADRVDVNAKITRIHLALDSITNTFFELLRSKP